MSKDVFHNRLKYGKCHGSVVIHDMRLKEPGHDDECYWGNAGQSPGECPMSMKKCNCCKRCTAECTRKRYILDRNHLDRQEQLEKIKEALDLVEEKNRRYQEAKNLVKKHFGI